MCTYSYVGKIPICHSFLGCLGIFDFSHRSRNPFDNFMSSAGQYNRGSFEIRLKKIWIYCLFSYRRKKYIKKQKVLICS